ncbi:MAG: RES domain-containing protein [Chloroflexi bacterium]|nr:RES domain-containing protein [Chloroflexota bacterium]
MQLTWYRLHPTNHTPLHFAQKRQHRFDDPRQRFGVLYAAETIEGAFIETFGRNPGVNLVLESQLAARTLALITPSRALKLVDLTGPGLAMVGATESAASGSDSAPVQLQLEVAR